MLLLARMSVKAFIVHGTYRMEDGQAVIYLFGRQEDGQSFTLRIPYEPYFYIQAEDEERVRELLARFTDDPPRFTHGSWRGPWDEGLSRITLRVPKHVAAYRDYLKDATSNTVRTYEADIPFVRRYLIDRDVYGFIQIEGAPSPPPPGVRTSVYYETPRITPAEPFPVLSHLRIASLDIETDPGEKFLWAWSLAFPDKPTVSRIVREDPEDQKQALIELFTRIREYDPDILTGWNLIDFDLAFLRRVAQEYKLMLDLSRHEAFPTHLRVYEAFLRESTADAPGRMILDGIHLLKWNYYDFEDYTLNTVARSVLGEEKLFSGKQRKEDIRTAYEENPDLLKAYNARDAELVLRILDKTGVLAITLERSTISGCFLDEVKSSIVILDNLYLRRLRKEARAWPSTDHDREDRRITGGYVHESQPGLYDWVIVLDFKSLYPSIIATFNIDPLTHTLAEAHPDWPMLEAPNKTPFITNHEGILPRLVVEIMQHREDAKRKHEHARSSALKVTMNSFFGVLANKACRFADWDVADAITHFGRMIIKETIRRVEEEGYHVIYGDTDSIFVHLENVNATRVWETGKQLADGLNAWWEERIRREYARESRLVLEFEKVYKRFWMPTIRGGEEGSKKRYAGLLVTRDGAERIDIVGLEYVRSDWTDAAREFQYGILEILFTGGDVKAYIRDMVRKLKAGLLDEKLVYKKQLRKPLEAYTKTTPPHVKAARLLPRLEGTLIKYVMTTAGPEPVGYVKHPLDYDHYLKKQFKPVADQILKEIGLSFDNILYGSQTGLGRFMKKHA